MKILVERMLEVKVKRNYVEKTRKSSREDGLIFMLGQVVTR